MLISCQFSTVKSNVHGRRQKFSRLEEEIVDEKCEELKSVNFIRRATKRDNILYVNPIVVAAKKDEEGNWTDKRFCVDLRETNLVTDSDPIPDAAARRSVQGD